MASGTCFRVLQCFEDLETIFAFLLNSLTNSLCRSISVYAGCFSRWRSKSWFSFCCSKQWFLKPASKFGAHQNLKTLRFSSFSGNAVTVSSCLFVFLPKVTRISLSFARKQALVLGRSGIRNSNSGYFPPCNAVVMVKIEARPGWTRTKGCSMAQETNKNKNATSKLEQGLNFTVNVDFWFCNGDFCI